MCVCISYKLLLKLNLLYIYFELHALIGSVSLKTWCTVWFHTLSYAVIPMHDL